MKKKVIITLIIILGIIVAITSNFASSDLDSKRIAFIGDSLMRGYENNDNSFEYYFSKGLPEAKLVNYSKSGATLSIFAGREDICIYSQIDTIEIDPDIIMLEGGANDIIAYQLGHVDKSLEKEVGKVDEETLEVEDENTVLGDFEKIILKLKEKFPNAKLCYVQLFLIDDDTVDHITLDGSKRPILKQRRDDLFSGIKLLCQKYGVEYIDVTNILEGTGTKYRQDDYIHLKEEGYQLLVHYLLENLKK